MGRTGQNSTHIDVTCLCAAETMGNCPGHTRGMWVGCDTILRGGNMVIGPFITLSSLTFLQYYSDGEFHRTTEDGSSGG